MPIAATTCVTASGEDGGLARQAAAGKQIEVIQQQAGSEGVDQDVGERYRPEHRGAERLCTSKRRLRPRV
jgi:hypothetical protein